MIVASLNFRARPHKRAEVISAADALALRMRTVRGCSRTRLLSDVEDLNALTLISEWADSGSAEAYFDSRDFQGFLGMRILLREEPFLVIDEIGTRAIRPVRERRR